MSTKNIFYITKNISRSETYQISFWIMIVFIQNWRNSLWHTIAFMKVNFSRIYAYRQDFRACLVHIVNVWPPWVISFHWQTFLLSHFIAFWVYTRRGLTIFSGISLLLMLCNPGGSPGVGSIFEIAMVWGYLCWMITLRGSFDCLKFNVEMKIRPHQTLVEKQSTASFNADALLSDDGNQNTV